MSIEITNHGILGQSQKPGEEAQTGAAQRNNTEAEIASGRPEQTLSITDKAQKLSELQQAATQTPVVRTDKVELTRKQLDAGELLSQKDINTSSENIANKLLEKLNSDD